MKEQREREEKGGRERDILGREIYIEREPSNVRLRLASHTCPRV